MVVPVTGVASHFTSEATADLARFPFQSTTPHLQSTHTTIISFLSPVSATMSPEEYVKNVEAVCDLVFRLWDISISYAQSERVKHMKAWPRYEDAPYQHRLCIRPGNADFWLVEFEKSKGKDEDGDPILSYALTGAAFALPDEQSEMQRALLMHNQCDRSWVVMRATLTRFLHAIDSDILVEPVHVIPEPLIQILEIEEHPAEEHSALYIITAHGSFVLDLTKEQYGFKKDPILLSAVEYIDQCVVDEEACEGSPWYFLDEGELASRVDLIERSVTYYGNRFWDVTKEYLAAEVS